MVATEDDIEKGSSQAAENKSSEGDERGTNLLNVVEPTIYTSDICSSQDNIDLADEGGDYITDFSNAVDPTSNSASRGSSRGSIDKNPEIADEIADEGGEQGTNPSNAVDPTIDTDSTDRVEQPRQVEYEQNGSDFPAFTPNRNYASRKSSMELRRLPVNMLLKPYTSECASVLSEESGKDDQSKGGLGGKKGMIHVLCLRPGYTLRTQLILSFETINAITTVIVVAICIAVSIWAGDQVKEISKNSFEILVKSSQGKSARYLAEALNERLLPLDTVSILYEATRDRFSGYPNDSDDEVPFVDMDAGGNMYPIIGQPVPFDWQLQSNVNDDNYAEHFQGREYYRRRVASTTNAGFLMQGACDPSITDPISQSYWPNCTEANNDVSTGGVVAPSPTTEQIHRKGSDMVPLLKALFEAKEEVRDIGLYFSNSGAGASINYPQYVVPTNLTYVSSGCDWMKGDNPYDPSKPIGNKEMIDRCHDEGEVVSSRAYNALERNWCIFQALDPFQFNVSVDLDPWDDEADWLLSVGRAVYDRVTNEFLACIHVGISLSELDEELKKSRITNQSEVSMVIWGTNGTVLSSSKREIAGFDVPVYETDLGLNEETWEELYNLVDYSSSWDPDEVRSKYENFSRRDSKYFVASHPLPPVPEKYDFSYRPLAVALISTAVDDVFSVVGEVNDAVDDKVRNVNAFAIVVGAVGLGVATLVIFIMASMLTAPLRSMNKVASEIVDNFGDPTREQRIESDGGKLTTKEARYTPKTELSEVVAEFNKMISSFSGSAMAKSEAGQHQEAENHFAMQRHFAELYANRSTEDFPYRLDLQSSSKSASGNRANGSIVFIHTGSNLISDAVTSASRTTKDMTTNSNSESGIPPVKKRSSLFLWTVVLIITPLLVANIIITAVVMNTVNVKLDEGVDIARSYFLEFRTSALQVHSRLRADYVSSLTTKSTTEMFLLARYASWLLFGGLERSKSFPKMTTGVEACKDYADSEQCPYVEENAVCDCAWKEDRSESCQTYAGGSRHLQIPFWHAESQLTQGDGDRNTTGFPAMSYSRDTTEWWDDATRVPGHEKTSAATGHDSTYDRLRSVSGLPLFPVLFNHVKKKRTSMSHFFAFEADGTFMGYRGCFNNLHAFAARWASTESNQASLLRPELCPVGKHGLDPRCRGWYDTGRKLAMLNGTFLYVTAPYEFALTIDAKRIFAQSVTVPLVDPKTGEHVGQGLLDFTSDHILDVLKVETPLSAGGFPILVAVQGDGGGDAVIGPDFSLSMAPKSISDVVEPTNQTSFNEILKSMKLGEEGKVEFSRKVGSRDQEKIHLAFSPVPVKSFRPIDSSDFSRGVETSEYLIYSVGLAETEGAILEPFDEIEDGAEKQINLAIGIVSSLLLVAAVVVIYISHHVTESITAPMLYCLQLIDSITRFGVDQEHSDPRKTSGSREISMFSETMEMLYKVVRSANTAFYAGELEMAYTVLGDALRLFKRLENKKAIGIASNNLGNTMLGMYQETTANNLGKFAGLTKKQMITKGIAYFHEAIQLGEKAYDEFFVKQGWTPVCLDFMQHLANRYFNRGLFLLSVKDEHEKPQELEELGMRDLQIARDMDAEVLSYGEDIGWGSEDRIEKLFNVSLVRARGYNILLALGYEDEWQIKELLDETFDTIKAEVQFPTSELFARVTVTGRMQEIETELMKYRRTNGELETAAKIAVRMLQEDESVFVEAQSQAIEMLLEYVECSNVGDASRPRMRSALEKYRDFLEDTVDDQNEAAMDGLDSDFISRSAGAASSRSIQSSRSWKLNSSGGRFVTMEDY